MFILKLVDNSTPFAVCNDISTFAKAIEEETLLSKVTLTNVILPDWGDTNYFHANGVNDENDNRYIQIEIQKIVSY